VGGGTKIVHAAGIVRAAGLRKFMKFSVQNVAFSAIFGNENRCLYVLDNLCNIVSSGYFHFVKIQENLRRNQIFTDRANANTYLFNATDVSRTFDNDSNGNVLYHEL